LKYGKQEAGAGTRQGSTPDAVGQSLEKEKVVSVGSDRGSAEKPKTEPKSVPPVSSSSPENQYSDESIHHQGKSAKPTVGISAFDLFVGKTLQLRPGRC
jgi:hypothetical protein